MARRKVPAGLPDDDPLWYRDAVIYELHVRAFHDSDGDGIGDFAGLTEKLDYLRDLGVTALWLLPFYPSPLRDDGYDIADYRTVHPSYGTLDDFRRFLAEAHGRGLRVITELVINHTSDQHPWFQRARRAPPGSPERDFYVWSDDPARYAEARIIFQDFERSNWTWDPEAEAYYWHRFYHHQPDLNFDNPRVRKEVMRMLDYWFELGVDGMRLDAIPYLFERDGTNCENLPETHAFLKELRAHLDRRFRGRMLLAEANQWPEDAAAYFGDGDECHMNFHFPIMPRLFMALRMEDRFPIVDILEQTPDIPDTCQWALFLRNHDELTLEMVTDEERDYMYRAYALDREARINLGIRRRLAPLLDNHRRKIELMNSLLFSLPGTPVLYFGDEIGMGDNFYLGDRNGVRTPMQWSSDRNAGFSRTNPQRLYLPVVIDPEYHYESVNVDAQQGNPSSLLWWMRRLIALRKRHRAFGRGSLEWLDPGNPRIVAFIRRHEDETILVVANLSRFVQAVELDLSRFRGSVPVELFGHTSLPPIGELPYFVTLGPHDFYWLALAPEPAYPEAIRPRRAREAEAEEPPPAVAVSSKARDAVFGDGARAALEAALVDFLPEQRWFPGKGRTLRGARVADVVTLSNSGRRGHVLLVEVDFVEEDAETYVVPLAVVDGEAAARRLRERRPSVVCRLEGDGDGVAVLVDALAEPEVAFLLLETLAKGREAAGRRGRLAGVPALPARAILDPGEGPLDPRLGQAEQSNSSIRFGERWMLKVFRRLHSGVSVDREMGEALTEIGFPHAPGVVGALEYRGPGKDVSTVAVLQEFVRNRGDAWEHAVEALDQYLERALAASLEPDEAPLPDADPVRAATGPVPDPVGDLLGPYLESAELLGTRTGEMHGALASRTDDPAFAPEPFTKLYQRSLYQSLRNQSGRTLRLLGRLRRRLPEPLRGRVETVLERKERILERFRGVLEPGLDGRRIRCHGDYHLGQVLHTGKDFVIIDFEGEPARSIGERRLKRSPLRDVAGMLRSFEYAGRAELRVQRERGMSEAGGSRLEAWVSVWHRWSAAAFLRGYLEALDGSALLPSSPADVRKLLEVFLLEKALYEAAYEIENRPDWLPIPVEGILELTDA